MYVPTEWAAVTRFATEGDHQFCVITIDMPNCHLCIVNFYLSCRGYMTSAAMYAEALDQLREIFIKYSTTYTVIVCGDFNASVKQSDHIIVCLPVFARKWVLVRQKTTIHHGPTFHHSDGRSSQVDYFLIHKERVKTICKVEFKRKVADLNTADHFITDCTRELQ